MEYPTFDRHCLPFTNKCDRFLATEPVTYDKQYYSIYRRRLNQFRPEIISKAKQLLGNNVIIRRLTELNENEKCLVIGTIYKQQELKPNILKEIALEANVLPQPIRSTKFTAADDKLILEDENLRVLLTGNINLNEFVTGVTVGLFGCVEESGSFDVTEVIYPLIAPSPARRQISWPDDGNYYVLLLSGLSFGAKSSSSVHQVLRCSMLVDWINGFFGQTDELANKITRVSRVIIAGNSISEELVDKNYGRMARYLLRKIDTPTVEAVQSLDTFLASIALTVEVDLMPGQSDPVNRMLPQQPFHKCMLPKAAEFESVQGVTNPYCAELAGVSFLGTSGQNVDDIYKFCEENNRLKIASWNLRWRHLSPSAPDTLDCYPFIDNDPFFMDERPDVYFVGNQTEFGCDRFDDGNGEKTLVITLPNFARTGLCALVNLKNLSVEPLMIGPDAVIDAELTEAD